jgi:hypothetical protein
MGTGDWRISMLEVQTPPAVQAPTVTKRLVTAEELWAMGDIGRCELVAGEKGLFT